MNPYEPHMLYSDDDYAVFYKPSGLPTAPLCDGDANNALYEAAKVYPNLLSVTSKYKEIEKGLVHRIDTNTSGLILIAGNQQSYNNLIQQQKDHSFCKYYTAWVTHEKNVQYEENLVRKGFPKCPYDLSTIPLQITSSFRKYGPGGIEVRPVLKDTMSYYAKIKSVVQEYYTEILSITNDKQTDTVSVYKVRCKIDKGFRHQVRCHLSWIGLPIIGDAVYGSVPHDETALNTDLMLFFADTLEFFVPSTNKKITHSLDNSFFDTIFLTSANK